MPLVEGTEVAGHRVIGLIAEGPMGTVHLAESLQSGERVALKVLRDELAADEAFRQRFLREGRNARQVQHPNVVRVREAGEAGRLLYIAMDHVEGEDLAAILAREGPLEPERAVAILAQVGAALDAAHAAGVVHRDVKPGNVMVTWEAGRERALLTDFGLSKRPGSDSVALTAAGEYVGTFLYTPPEQILGTELDGRADVYSLACVLYECLTGAPPFATGQAEEILSAHVDAPPPSVHERRPGLPAVLDATFARALAKDPEARFATCGELMSTAAAVMGAQEGGVREAVDREPGLRLEVTAGAAGGTEVVVADEFVIGRHAEGAGRLQGDSELSREHARISRAGFGYLVEDLGSTNGTFLNGRRIGAAEALGVGDELQVGGTTLIVRSTGEESETVERAPGPALPPVSLRVELDLEAGEARIELDEGSDSVRLAFEDGAWRLRPGDG